MSDPPWYKVLKLSLAVVYKMLLSAAVVVAISMLLFSIFGSTAIITVGGLATAGLGLIFGITTNAEAGFIDLLENYTLRCKVNDRSPYSRGYENTYNFIKKWKSKGRIFRCVVLISNVLIFLAGAFIALRGEGWI